MQFIFLFGVIASFIIVAQSCKTTSETSTAEPEGIMKADIGEGKVIFMRDCSRCHIEKKVENFTAAQWANILPRMIPKAQLNETQGRQVTAYIEWELEND